MYMLPSSLQGTPATHHATLSACLCATIGSALSTQWIEGDEKRMQYLEALMENFPPGEGALRQMIPSGTGAHNIPPQK